MFGSCGCNNGCNSGCGGCNNRGLFGICLNDCTLIIILIAIWLLSSGGTCGCSGCDCA